MTCNHPWPSSQHLASGLFTVNVVGQPYTSAQSMVDHDLDQVGDCFACFSKAKGNVLLYSRSKTASQVQDWIASDPFDENAGYLAPSIAPSGYLPGAADQMCMDDGTRSICSDGFPKRDGTIIEWPQGTIT